MSEYIDKDYKIKAISFIFETKYNDKLSEKVLSIINNYDSLDYTINNNGIFINLNVLDNEILDMIYYVVSDYEKEINIDDDNDINMNYSNSPIISSIETFVKKEDNIMYNEVDSYLLELSTQFLTI